MNSSKNTFSKKQKSTIREYVEAFAIALLLAIILRSFVIEPFKIPSPSMVPTLLVGDRLFVNKFIYGLRIPFTKKWLVRFQEPQRGDVVVFTFPGAPDPKTAKEDSFLVRWFYKTEAIFGTERVKKWDQALGLSELDYIKRVVAVPGDRVEFNGRDLLVNGQKVNRYPVSVQEDQGKTRRLKVDFNSNAATLPLGLETFVELPQFTMPGDLRGSPERHWSDFDFEVEQNAEVYHWIQHEKNFTAPFVGQREVPEGYLFVMGDNRNHSSDSRVWGFVPMENLRGKAMFFWLSVDEEAAAQAGGGLGNWFKNIRWERFAKWIY